MNGVGVNQFPMTILKTRCGISNSNVETESGSVLAFISKLAMKALAFPGRSISSPVTKNLARPSGLITHKPPTCSDRACAIGQLLASTSYSPPAVFCKLKIPSSMFCWFTHMRRISSGSKVKSSGVFDVVSFVISDFMLFIFLLDVSISLRFLDFACDDSPAINGGASQALLLWNVAPLQFCSFLLR